MHIFEERMENLQSTNMCPKLSSMHLCNVVCESPAAMTYSLRVWLSVSVYRTPYDPCSTFLIYDLSIHVIVGISLYCLINLLWCT